MVQGYQRLLGHGLAGSGSSRQDGQRAAHSGEYRLALLVVEGHPQFRLHLKEFFPPEGGLCRALTEQFLRDRPGKGPFHTAGPPKVDPFVEGEKLAVFHQLRGSFRKRGKRKPPFSKKLPDLV